MSPTRFMSLGRSRWVGLAEDHQSTPTVVKLMIMKELLLLTFQYEQSH